MYTCPECGREFKKKGNCLNHIEFEHRNNIKSNTAVTCEFCGKSCKNLKGYNWHIKFCKKNPQHKEFNRNPTNESRQSGFELWRQKHPGEQIYHPFRGQTKDTCSELFSVSQKRKEKYRKGELISHQKGKPRTEEEKRKISETMKKNPNAGGLRQGSGRGKKGWYKGYFCDSTYELVYIIYNLDHNINFKRCDFSYQYEYDGKIKKYFPDFILDDGSLVEIKGYLTNKDIIKLQAVKDRPIQLFMEKDLKYAFDYVKATYPYKHLKDLYET